jgi:hypothetical protein
MKNKSRILHQNFHRHHFPMARKRMAVAEIGPQIGMKFFARKPPGSHKADLAARYRVGDSVWNIEPIHGLKLSKIRRDNKLNRCAISARRTPDVSSICAPL